MKREGESLVGKGERQNPVCGEGRGIVSVLRTQSVRRGSVVVWNEGRGCTGDEVGFYTCAFLFSPCVSPDHILSLFPL